MRRSEPAWRKATLGDVARIEHGWPFKSECFSDRRDLPVVVGIGNFRYTGGFRFGETTIKTYSGEYPRQYELAPRDILVVMTCQTPGGEILGVPARVPDDGKTYLHNQRLGRVVVRDRDRLDPDFLYWALLMPAFNRHLVASASGTKILHTSPTRIESAPIALPPLSEQRSIARILDALDDRIELNRRTNETLEAMARALFKSWFVDRELASDAGTTCSAEDLIREGVLTIGDGYRAKNDELGAAGLPFIRAGNVFDNRIQPGAETLLPDRVHLAGEKRSTEGDVVFTSKGTVGRFALVGASDPEVVYSPQLCFWRSHDRAKLAPVYLFFWMRSRDFELQIGSVKGQTDMADYVSLRDQRNMKVLLPPPAAQQRFASHAGVLLSRVDRSNLQNRTLASLRDALLPKLLSGQLRVRDAERAVSAVL